MTELEQAQAEELKQRAEMWKAIGTLAGELLEFVRAEKKRADERGARVRSGNSDGYGR